jgi:fatty-acyl-CoA synthase
MKWRAIWWPNASACRVRSDWQEAPMSNPAIRPQTVHELLDQNAALRPSGVALSCKGEVLTHAQLAKLSMAAADYLHSLGVSAGDRIAIFVPVASADYLALALGAMRLGAIAACLNARFKIRELNHAIDNSACKLLFYGAMLKEVVDASTARDRTIALQMEDVRAEWREARMGRSGWDPAGFPVGPDAPARIIYTSGTTAMPKACLHTHGAMLHQGFSVAERLELHDGDRFWTPLPLFHTGGWTPYLAAQAAGASLHHAGFFEAGESLRQMVDEKCTILFPSFETIWMQVLTHPDFDAKDFDSARLVLNVGVPERLEMMQRMLPHVPQVSNTGCTEVGGFLCIGRETDSLESRCTTAGPPLSGMEAKIVDPATGEDLPNGREGELLVRGPACLSEYYRDPEATRTAIEPDGWFHTGDLLRRTDAGEFVFVSRIKDMLKVGGENVAAAEIEGHILTHPNVHLVAVVSAPDDYYGEVPAAFIEPVPGAELSEQEVIDFCKGVIANFKVPKYVRFVDEWPMSGTKIKKFELRDRIRESIEQAAAG